MIQQDEMIQRDGSKLQGRWSTCFMQGEGEGGNLVAVKRNRARAQVSIRQGQTERVREQART